MSANNIVWCHLLTHTYRSAFAESFYVKCLGFIQDLKEAVKNSQSDICEDIKPQQLVVWRCPESPILRRTGVTIEDQVKRVIADKLDKKFLFQDETVADISLDLKPNEVLIVQLPTTVRCFVFDPEKGKIDTRPLRAVAYIKDLVKKVLARQLNLPEDIKPQQLIVWRCPKSPILDSTGDTIEDQVKRVIADNLDKQILFPMQTLANLALVADEVLIVQLPNTVSCFVFDPQKGIINTGPLRAVAYIKDLIKKVLAQQSNLPEDIKPQQLIVWRCPKSPILDSTGDTIEDQVKRVIADNLDKQLFYHDETVVDISPDLKPNEVLIVQLPTAVRCLALSCDNRPIGQPFQVFVQFSNNGAKLKEKAVQAGGAALKDIHPTDIILWKLYKPRPFDEIHNPECFKKFHFFRTKSEVTNENKNESVVELSPEAEVGTPEDWTNGGMHVLVQVPQPRGAKRKAHQLNSDQLKELEGRKHNLLAILPPSVIGKPHVYEQLQAGANRILDGRPEPDLHIPPIHLLYDGFGLFHDIFKQDTVAPEEIKTLEMTEAVDRFALEMTRLYPNEDARRDAGLPLLDNIFAARKEPLLESELRASAIGSARTDGHVIGPHGVPSMIFKFKSLRSGISSLPEPDIVPYFAHLQRTAIQSAREPDLYLRWRIPCIGIVVIGWEIRFHALLTLGGRFRSIPLTPAISCVAAASNGWERKALRRAFMAASVLLARIHTDCKSSLKFPENTPLPYLPAISTLGTLGIKNLLPCFKSHECRYVYSAEDNSGREILVKFTPTYSPELHRFCHAKGHAPALLACEVLPGGWYGIAMEYLTDIDPISLSPSLGEHRHKWEGELRELTKSFHQSGLVHGDLRDANIVCNSEGKLWLIDFDWGGEDGKVFYPTEDLHKELISGRTSNDLAITASDDERVLEITLKKMKQILEMDFEMDL